MAVLTYAELSSLVLDAVQANVTVDAPISAAEMARKLNDNYALVWEIEGGSLKKVASATAWTSAQTATGVVAGVLTDINEILHVFASTTSGSVGFSTGDKELTRKDMSYIQDKRSNAADGTYSIPKVYAVQRLATVTPADVGKVELHYWPSVTGFYLPIHYVPQFTPIDSATVTVPDLTDLGSRDVAWMTAADFAPLLGRAELVPEILMKISEGTAIALERKAQSLLSGKQDR